MGAVFDEYTLPKMKTISYFAFMDENKITIYCLSG